jgi:hypothetical protein
MSKLTHKICSKCKRDKDISFYYEVKRKYGTGYDSWCKTCRQDHQQSSKTKNYAKEWRENMRLEISQRTEKGIAHLQQSLWHSAKGRATLQNLEFTISKEDIQIPTHCPVLGIELQMNKNAIGDNSPTLDRIDPTKGYIRENIVVISGRANRIKNNATLTELQKVWEWVSQRNSLNSP